MKRSVCITLLACLACPTVALAGDDEARAKLEQAFAHWGDEDPTVCLKLIEEAEAAEPTDPFLYNQILVSKGSVYHVKTGELDKALKLYSEVIRNLAGAEDEPLKQIKAEAMVRKGNLIYSEDGDTKAAMQMFIAAHQTFSQSTTADVASQLSLRLAFDKATSVTKRQGLFEQALTLADEAIASVAEQFVPGDALDQQRAKFQLQKVLVLQAMEMADEAEELYGSIDSEHMVEMSWYQMAVYSVMKGEVDEGTAVLKRWLKTRQTVKTRNQARKFIRNEPHFADLLEREDWSELTTDERVRDRPGVRVGGATARPGSGS